MRLGGALDTDSLPMNVNPGSWSNARNMVLNKKGKAISNEDGVQDITPVIGGVGTAAYPSSDIIGKAEIDGDTVLFFASTNISDGQIGVLKSDGKYYPKLKDAISKVVLNLNINFPVQAVAQKKFNGNIIVCFKDADGVPKILDIDCIPFKVDNDYTVNNADVAKANAVIKTFPDFKVPTITNGNLSILDGGGGLPSGIYYLVIAYELADGSITPWSDTFNGIPISTSSLTGQSTTVSGGILGATSNKSINVTFTNVDTNYRRIKIGYIYTANGQTKAFSENSYLIPSTTMTVLITGNQAIEIDVSDIVKANVVYSKVHTIATLQRALYFGNVEQAAEFNFQTYANSIGVEWVREEQIYINGTVKNGSTGTYQNPTTTFFSKTFKSGECYALYIGIKLTNGTWIKACHIPGRQSVSGDKDIMNPSTSSTYYNYNMLDSNNPVYRYQVDNTSSRTTNTHGPMGFWENENEKYPLDPANSANVHPDYANIPGVTASNRKVRHHVFPDLTTLDDGVNTEVFLDGPLIGGGGTYPVQGISSKAYGIKISNVNIPLALLPFVDSWQIFYAERGNANIRILGNDCPSNSTGSTPQYLRFQQFDLMNVKPGISPNYIKPVYIFDSNGQSSDECNFVEGLDAASPSINSDAVKIRYIHDFTYLGENTTIPQNNTGKADNIIVAVDNAALTISDVPDITASGIQSTTLCDICIFKRDVYLNFNTQTLVATGRSFKITASGVQSTQNIYGGDTYINRASNNPLNTGTKSIHYVCETASNVGYRKEDPTQSKFFAPKYSNPTPSWYGYDTDYNAINKFIQLDIHYPNDGCLDANITKYPYRIPFSLQETTEGHSLNWRVFKINNYHESVNNKGEIWNLLGNDKTLYIHHTSALFVARIKDTFTTGSGEEISIKTSQIFDTLPTEVLPVDEGYAGTQSQFACIACKLGYCFFDKQRKKLFIYGQNGLREISAEGMFNFFLNNSDQTYNVGDDNPFIGSGYIMAYDTRYNRLLVTKKDIDLGSGNNPFTLSYSPNANNGQGGWVSFHDYTPSLYISNRNGLFAINNIQRKVFKHNYITNKSTFYDGVIKKSYIEIPSNDIPATKKFDSLSWLTTVESGGVNYPSKTFSHIVIYNDTQCSGEVAILPNAGTIWYAKDARNVEGCWYYNDFRDMVNDITQPFFDSKKEIIGGNISATKPWYKRSQFIAKYAVFRLIVDNQDQKDLHLSEININFKQSER